MGPLKGYQVTYYIVDSWGRSKLGPNVTTDEQAIEEGKKLHKSSRLGGVKRIDKGVIDTIWENPEMKSHAE